MSRRRKPKVSKRERQSGTAWTGGVCRCGRPTDPGYSNRCEDCWAEDHRFYCSRDTPAVGPLGEITNQDVRRLRYRPGVPARSV